MKKRRQNRRISIILIVGILLWNVFPLMAMAFTPGQPITPGEAITPGDPISGGEFIVPGEIYDYGEAYKDGSPVESGDSLNSGKPIIEGSTSPGGQFITPNAPPTLFPIMGGEAIQSGDGIQAGNQVDAGSAGTGGTAVEGGSASNGGEPDANGSAVNGGNGPNGSAMQGGNGPNGSATQGGNGPNGNPTQGGNGPNGDATSGNSTNSGEPPSLLNTIFRSTSDSDSFIDMAANIAKDVKNYALRLGDDVAQGLIATHAGFKFKQLADGKYSVYGKNSLNNSIGNWFYDRYRSYNYNGNNANYGPHARRVGEARYNAFMQSKNIGGPGSLLSSAGNSTRSALNSSWNVASSSFWKPSNMMKMGGPVGVALTSVGSVSKYSDGFTDFGGLASTDFAATLTSDVAVGVASTAVGSVASSMAAGAVAGSVVPGFGTVIGAGAGLIGGIATTYFFNSTGPGRAAKKFVTDVAKKGYDAVVDGFNKTKDAISDGISKIGSFLGVGG
ncbi:hypothetical protein [Virgibacillus sp. JSM 102003]|uniref:hypothetical protein n=1 Tax=Virgibacillus sp. JSM 102003 TaxID=1562108 RepID=UPI0035BFFAA8